MGIERKNCWIIDSNDRTCQKISDSKDRKDSNIRKGGKNRNGPVMRSHDRSLVIVSFVTLGTTHASNHCPVALSTIAQTGKPIPYSLSCICGPPLIDSDWN